MYLTAMKFDEHAFICRSAHIGYGGMALAQPVSGPCNRLNGPRPYCKCPICAHSTKGNRGLAQVQGEFPSKYPRLLRVTLHLQLYGRIGHAGRLVCLYMWGPYPERNELREDLKSMLIL